MNIGSGSTSGWSDSHCHVHDEPDPDALIDRARSRGVDRLILVGTDHESSKKAAELARSRPEGVWSTIGLHPHEASKGSATLAGLLSGMQQRTTFPAGSVVAIGECGLDYYYEHSPRDAQRVAFAEQIELAKRYGLALVIHTRDAWDDTFSILNELGSPARTVIHCFTGGVEEARACLDLGAVLSFSGIVTFKNAQDIRDAAIYCPIDSMLVETDSPYLAPVPHRGERNEPAYVVDVGEAVAALRGIDAVELRAATAANTAAVFGLVP